MDGFHNGTGLSPRHHNHNHHTRGRSVSMDELNFSFSQSDTDSVHSATSPGVSPVRRHKKRPTPYVNNRPRSAEPVGYGMAGLGGPMGLQRSIHAGPHWNSRSVHASHRMSTSPHSFKGQFVAIADYDPHLFSQSGRQRLELLLREGDEVTVIGPMDRHGYCEAEVGSRTGLVPAIYLQPVESSRVASQVPVTTHEQIPVKNGHAANPHSDANPQGRVVPEGFGMNGESSMSVFSIQYCTVTVVS